MGILVASDSTGARELVLPFGPLEHGVQLFTQFGHFPFAFRYPSGNYGFIYKTPGPSGNLVYLTMRFGKDIYM
ncbi:MAG: hypothetical protein O7C75_00345 [Verrucomicrobia bacterium]|nr:hypothetical protein [Verrucomicrobiota bacterium]